MQEILDLIRQRHSGRFPYDPKRKLTTQEIAQILEAASWAPTAHNMQNFEVLVVDDPATLDAIGAIKTKISAAFLRENFQELSFSEDELRHKKTGVLASMFPQAWRTPGADFDAIAAAAEPVPLAYSLQDCPCLLLVLYDPHKRAPASEGDILGFISLGCVMQNMWLVAESLGIGLQILSVFSSEMVEREVQRMLHIPSHLKIAYACRVGHPAVMHDYLRVRRNVNDFAHRNRYGNKCIE